MQSKTMAITGLMCLLFLFCMLTMTESAEAQSADQKMATREGLAEADIDRDRLPGRLELGLVIGSIIAMIGVVKYV